jgi:proteic killer suppression protein
MIVSIRHKGLRDLFESGHSKSIKPNHTSKVRMQMLALDTAVTIEDMDIPGYRLHALKGNHQDRWSISVDKNWRLTFEFQDGNVYLLDYEDYH